MRRDITIVADLFRDYWIQDQGFLQFPIEKYPHKIGGNLKNLSDAAKILFKNVYLIGAVNYHDYEIFFNELKSKNATPFLTCSDKHTGTCVILIECGSRINVITLKGANTEIVVNDSMISDGGYLFLTGWLFYPTDSITSKSALWLINQSLKRNVQIIFDMLPHSIDVENISIEYNIALQSVDILIIEKETFKRIFSEPNISQVPNQLPKLKLMLLYNNHQETGTCKSVSVYNYTKKNIFSVAINYDQKISEKWYLDYTALEIISNSIC